MIRKLLKFIFGSTREERRILIKDNLLTAPNENLLRACKLAKKITNANNKIIVDIGAYDGMSSLLFSKQFPENEIYAFEANPKVFERAKTNTRRNSKITVLNNAVSEENGKIRFNITKNEVSSSINQVNKPGVKQLQEQLEVVETSEVEMITLDSYLKKKEIMILKIDVQGHEMSVLEGAIHALENTDIILIELSNHKYYENGCQYYEVDEWLRKHDFKLVDQIITYRENGVIAKEFDALYINSKLHPGY